MRPAALTEAAGAYQKSVEVMPMFTKYRRKLKRNRDAIVALVIIVGGGLSVLAVGLIQIS